MRSDSATGPEVTTGGSALPREALIAALCLLIGILVMPCVIFAVGRATLGPYQHGGVFALWRDFLTGLLHGSQAFWFVALAPYLLLWLGRAARRVWRGQPAHARKLT